MKKHILLLLVIFMSSLLLFGCQGSNQDQIAIKFNENGGTDISNIHVDKNESINKPYDPTKEGFIFGGWFSDEELSTAITWPYTPSSDMTLYAKWDIDPSIQYYTISWKVNGVIVEVDTNVKEGNFPIYHGAIPSKLPSLEYVYSFSGWSPSVEFATGNVIYEAQFSYNNRQYTITFNSNGGSLVDPITRNYGTIVSEPTEPTREGYTFMGWFLGAPTYGEIHWPVEVSDNFTFYAKWEAIN